MKCFLTFSFFFLSATIGKSQLCTGTFGNPFLNITFGSGASNPGGTLATVVSGASTTYTYAPVTGSPPGLVYDGEYSIINQVPNNTAWYAGAHDHTGNSNGYMAFFNAATTTGEFYKQTVSGLNANTVYEFAAWFGNVLKQGFFSSPSYPNITFEIRNASTNALIDSASTGNVPMSTTGALVWNQYGLLFTTPPGVTSVILRLTNKNVGGVNNPGNDFALDDITFRECICNTTTANAGSDRAICIGDTIQLSAIGGSKYRWAPASGLSNDTIANPLAFPSTTTDYIVTVSNGNCSSRDTVSISNNSCTICPQGAASLSAELITNGDFESGNTAFSTAYTYSTTIASQTQYTIANIASSVNSSFASCTDRTSGTGKYFLANGSGSTSTKVWYQTITIKPNTNYVLTFWANNLTGNSPAQIRVVVNGQASATFAVSNTSCLWKSYGFVWNSVVSTSTTVEIYDLNPAVNGNDFGLDDISVRECGCVPIFSNVPDQSICLGDSIQLNLANVNAKSYHWIPATGLSNDTIPNPWIKPNATTTYHIALTNGNCTSTDTITINIKQKPIINIGNDTILCHGASFILNSNAPPPRLWSTGDTSNTISVNIITDSVNFIPQKFWVKAGTGNCIGSDTILIYSLVRPQINTLLNGKTTICKGGNITLGLSKVPWWAKVKWSTGDTTKSIKASPSVTSYINVSYLNNECNFKDSILITVLYKPIINVSPGASICAGESTLLSVRGASSYQWNNNATDSNILVSPSTTTVYWVVGSNGTCISDTQKIVVTVLPTTKAVFTATPSAGSTPLNVLFLNQSNYATNYLWNFGDGDTSTLSNPSHTFNIKGNYTIQLIAYNPNGCNDTTYAQIIVSDPFYIFIPNAFTPDGDGLNDIFEISVDGIKYLEGTIYDRWGEQIYNWRIPGDKSWDGTYQGKLCMEGAYIYVLKVKDLQNFSHHFKGWIYLIR